MENSSRLDYADRGNSISSSFLNYARGIRPRIRDFLTSALSIIILYMQIFIAYSLYLFI